MKEIKTFIKRSLFTLLAASFFATSVAYADISITISDPEEDSSFYIESRRPSGFRGGSYDFWNSVYQPYRTRPVKDEEANTVHIDATESGASVYIDGSYKGTTPYSIDGLSSGRHTVKITKSHYETLEVSIYVDTKLNAWYYMDMERISGRVVFITDPSDTEVSLSGSGGSASSSSSGQKTLEVDEGNYTFTIRRFGYYEKTGTITVYRHSTRTVRAQLDPCPFELTSFTCDRKEFNPEAGGKFSKTRFSIGATAPASGTFEILNQDGDTVYKEGVTFNSWNTYIEWNGCDMTGTPLTDGEYTAVITAEEYINSVDIKINSELVFQHMKITADGSGIGPVASAELYPAGTLGFQIDYSIIRPITDDDDLFDGNLNLGLLWAISDYVEFASSLNFMNDEGSVFYFDLSLKTGSKIPLSASNLYWAFIFRYGRSSEPFYPPFGCDSGCGLGLGGALGFTNNKMYFGFQSEYIFNCLTGQFSQEDADIWKNAFLFQYTGKHITSAAYAAVNMGIGDYSIQTNDNYYMGSINNLVQSVQAGANLSIFLGKSAWTLDLGADAIYFPENQDLFTDVKIGFSVFF